MIWLILTIAAIFVFLLIAGWSWQYDGLITRRSLTGSLKATITVVACAIVAYLGWLSLVKFWTWWR